MGRPKRKAPVTSFGTRVIIYLRVSGEVQATEGHGLDAQEDACRDYAQQKGYTIVDILRDEAISGTKDGDERKGMEEALRRCEHHEADVFLCYALDRQSRDVVIFNKARTRLRKAHVRFETARERQDFTTDDSMLMGDIYSAFSAEERRRITARLYGGRRQRGKIDGMGSSTVPYGYRKCYDGVTFTRDGKPVPHVEVDTDAAHIVVQLLRYREQGHTYQDIATFLNEHDMPAPRGGQWSGGSVASVEANWLLYTTGRRKWADVESEKLWPVIYPPQE